MDSPGVRAAGYFLRSCRQRWLSLKKKAQTFKPVLWHMKSSSFHLHRFFFYCFPALTLFLLMIKDLKHFKTKLFTFRYFFNLCEKNRLLMGIYLTMCSLAPRTKIFWNTFLFISGLCECQAIQFFMYFFLKADFWLFLFYLLFLCVQLTTWFHSVKEPIAKLDKYFDFAPGFRGCCTSEGSIHL